MSENDLIVKWFNEHTIFNINGMCKMIGIDRGNFMKSLAAKKIPIQHLEKVKEVLFFYGYESPTEIKKIVPKEAPKKDKVEVEKEHSDEYDIDKMLEESRKKYLKQ